RPDRPRGAGSWARSAPADGGRARAGRLLPRPGSPAACRPPPHPPPARGTPRTSSRRRVGRWKMTRYRLRLDARGAAASRPADGAALFAAIGIGDEPLVVGAPAARRASATTLAFTVFRYSWCAAT